MLITAGIIDNVEQNVTGPDDNNIYTVETNSGYTVEIILDGNGNIQIGDIEKGALAPKIRDIKISTTAKETVARAVGKIITYEYKLETEPDSSYKIMTETEDYLWKLSCAKVWNDGYTEGTAGYAIQKEGKAMML